MKSIFFIILVAFLALSCSKNDAEIADNETYKEIPYDTTAIDSFSKGAISVDVAAQIRRSSVAYRDSLKAKAAAAEDAKKKAELEKLKKEAEKKEADKKESEKKKEEKTTTKKEETSVEATVADALKN